MQKIAVIGSEGYVGKAFVKMIEDHYDVVRYDPVLKEECASKDEVNATVLSVICVPTPMKKDKSCDTSIVEKVVSWLETPVILIKSAIVPGTTDYLRKKYKKRIVVSPEYISEERYYVTSRMDFRKDIKKCPFLILGGNDEDCNYILDLLVPVLGPEKIYYKVKPIEAEIIKYMENTYFGVKVTFANEMYDICQKFGADWYRVWKGWALDPRVDEMHTAVFPENRGFTGKCLPKDLNALVKASEKAGYTPIMLKAMLKSNREIRKRNGKKPDY